MSERLVEQKKAIQLYLTRFDKQKLDLKDDEWELVAEFALLLKPFEEVSNMFCQDSAPISTQFPLATMLRTNLSGLSVSSPLIAVKSKMLKLLKEKFFELESSRLVFKFFNSF